MRLRRTPPADRPRIFCIGLNKTATSSFHQAMTRLGFASLHHGGPEIEQAVSDALAAEEPLLSRIDARYDAFSDIGQLSRRFMMLDRQYPGSNFVLTVRPVDKWIDSRRRHVETNQKRAAAGEYNGKFVEVDEDKWRAEWDHHMERVHRYFAKKQNFVEVDFTAGAGWEPICDLLDVPVPSEAFPWANRGER
jgi:hypothetical protein